MGKYTVGPCVLCLTGHEKPAKEGETVEHDFSINGPDGEHGPAREAALILAGAVTPVDDRPSPRRRVDLEPKE